MGAVQERLRYTAPMQLTREQQRNLRGLGHRLKPIVTIADKGLSDNVMNELEQALDHHELMKVRLRIGDRAGKSELLNELCERTGASLVQTIGHIALLYRPNPEQARINPNARS